MAVIKNTYTSYKSTGYFSDLINDYLSSNEKLKSFYNYSPNDSGINQAIKDREKYSIDRKLLVQTLKKQYKGFQLPEKVKENMILLENKETYTVCSAHQPNLVTGYAYFFYKIIHSVKLAEHLKGLHPDKNFVPVFYIGSEDDDIQELGVFKYNNQIFKWNTNQTGAVGRMEAKELKPLLNELLKIMGPPGKNVDILKKIIQEAYANHTVSQAIRHIINELTGKYGVIVIDPDDIDLKRTFTPVMLQELLNPKAYSLVLEQSKLLGKNYKAQAYARPINLFYLKGNIRERIEKREDTWIVLNTNIKWSENELKDELHNHPDRFSPNVILRGLYQETILPNIAFIGGGSEVSYWFQLKKVFEEYNVFYPTIVLRQSVQWIDKSMDVLRQKLDLDLENIFTPTDTLVLNYIKHNSTKNLTLNSEETEICKILDVIKEKAKQIDITLLSSAQAVTSKIKYQIQVLEKKMLRAEKRNMSTQISQIYKLKEKTLPGGKLQERNETFLPFYALLGEDFFKELMQYTLPYGNKFLILIH